MLEHIVAEGDHVLEVGAGYGKCTVALAEMVGLTGYVISLEPNSEISLYLKETKRINNFQQIKIIERAAWNEGGHSFLQLGSIEEHAELDKEKGTVFIHTTTIDSIFEDIGEEKLQLLLLDTSSAWEEILSGANNLILNKQPVICIGNDKNLDIDAFTILIDNEYQFFEFIEEVGVLSQLEKGNHSTARWIFALTNDWVEKLAASGFIFINDKFNSELTLRYLESAQYQSWTQHFKSYWIGKPEIK